MRSLTIAVFVLMKTTVFAEIEECVTPFLPTIALLFITRGPLPHERIWADWLRTATQSVPCQGMNHTRSETLARIYVHAPPDFEGYPVGSVFHDKLILNRASTTWNRHTLAEKYLLLAALEDPSNQRFFLLSESCVPLYTPQVTYLQSLSLQQSSLACSDDQAR